MVRGFKEIKIGSAPDRTNSVRSDLFAKRKYYDLKHYVSMTIHAAMGDTLLSVATTISVRDKNFFLWDKGQLIVILSRTKLAKNTIVLGQEEDTLKAFRSLVSDHMEAVLDIITPNRDNERETKSDDT